MASGSPAGARPLGLYFVLLAALVVAAGLAGAYYVDRKAAAEARAAAMHDARHSVRTAAAQLGEEIAVIRATPASLAANPQITGTFEDPDGCTLTFQGLGGRDSSHLDVLRADGRVACSSGPGGADYSDASWFERSLREPLLLAPVRDAATGAEAAVATSPIPGGHGVVAAFVDLRSLAPSLADLYGGGRATVFTITTADDRTVISRSIDPARWVGTRVPPGGLRSAGEQTGLDGRRRLYARASVPQVGWNVYVGEETSAVLASVDRLRTRQLQTIALGIVLFLLAAAVVYRKVATPILRLSNAVLESSGKPVPSQVPVAGPKEVRRLGDQVNRLVGSVASELEERRRAEESYRLLFQNNPNPMWVFDLETLRFLAVNDAAVDAYGWSREEFLEMTIEDIRPPAEALRLRALLAGREEDRGLQHAGAWKHRRKDGSELLVEIDSHDHVFEGRHARVVTSLDVTERLAAEAALRRSEERYRDLFENASDLIATVDLEGRLTDVNQAFARTLAATREELLGRPLEELVAPESRELLRTAAERKLRGAEQVIFELELIAHNTRTIRVEVSSRLIERDGRPVGMEAICRDITERRRLEDELRQAQRLEAIGRLAGGVAHDFNNLLTVISGYTEALLLGRRLEDEPELEQIAIAARRAAALTRQLLAFSRRQVLQPRVIDLNDIVGGLAPMLGRLIGEDVALVTALADDLDPVRADPNQIEQVLVNLAVNARDAMPSGGRLLIQTANVDLDEDYVAQHGESTPGPHVMLSVSDDGVGMDAETLAHVFEPFFTTKPVGTGTGLGLATVYGIVKQSGGSVWVYSEPGHGTTIKVYLPRSEAGVVEETVRPATPQAARGSETILLAEDEESLRQLTARMLETRGYEVISAATATEAVRIAEAKGAEIQLLLTDLIMPELNGGDLARQVRAAVPGVRVLYMSGYADDVVTEKGALEPGAPFLEKPFTADDLAAKVREILDDAA